MLVDVYIQDPTLLLHHINCRHCVLLYEQHVAHPSHSQYASAYTAWVASSVIQTRQLTCYGAKTLLVGFPAAISTTYSVTTLRGAIYSLIIKITGRLRAGKRVRVWCLANLREALQCQLSFDLT